MFCVQGTPVIEILPQARDFCDLRTRDLALIPLPQHMLSTPVSQLFHRVASAMKLRHQTFVVASSSVEPAGRCSLDCMRLDAGALADVAHAALSHLQ
jgi:hypothetical protein